MSSPSPLDGLVIADPLTADQARWLVSTSPVPILVADVADGGYAVLAADPLLRRLVVGARHPAGPFPGEIIDDAGFGVLAPAMRAAVALPSEPQHMELPIGDEPLWFEVVISAASDERGVHQLLLVAADRTAAHDIEARERRSARRFHAMVTHAPGLILLVDSAGRIIRCSPAVDRFLGVDADTLVGRAIFEIMHPDTLARAASVFNQVLSQPGEPVQIDDFRLSHGSGGALWCEAIATNLLHDDDVAAIVFNAHDVTERRMAEQRLELAATSDALTGLANRRRLETKLHDLFSSPGRDDVPVGLAMVDLDEFKLVNDAMGHDIGDAVLRVIASRLEGVISGRGSVARVGGDEFAVVLEEVRLDDELDRLADAMHESLRTPINVGDHDVYVRGSVGTSSGTTARADAASLLRSADLALYRAKRNGKNQTVGFTAELQLEAEERLETITRLQQAIREGRLRLAYQPVVDRSGTTVGAEALLRWEHDGELLSPSTFLALAEDTGLILPIGAWVIDQVCRDLPTMLGADASLSWVSLNLSSRQLLDERLPLLVQRAVRAHSVPAGSLAVEVDEATMCELPDAAELLAGLGDLRIMITIDDLATRAGALPDLGAMHVDAVKLGGEFVRQLDLDVDGTHAALAGAMLELAQEAGVDVVAEGVETDAQDEALRRLGFERFQGFRFARPMDLGSFVMRSR